MSTERFQFHVRQEHDHEHERWSALKAENWPIASGESEWTCNALRVFYARLTEARAEQWYVSSHGARVRLEATDSLGTVGRRWSAKLGPEDTSKLHELLELGTVGSSNAAVLRNAVAFLAHIADAIKAGKQVLADDGTGAGERVVSIPLLLEGSGTERPTVEAHFPLQGMTCEPLVTVDPDPRLDRTESKLADDLFAIFETVEGLNEFLAQQVAHATALVETAQGAPPKLDGELLDIEGLVKRYAVECAERDGKPSATNWAVPSDWFRLRESDAERRSFALAFVEKYLASAKSKVGLGLPKPAEERVSRLPFRHWARHRVLKPYYECDAPLSWRAIVHAYLVSLGVPPSLVCHEIQRWLQDAYALRFQADAQASIDAVNCVNEIFYGSPVVSISAVHRGSTIRRTPSELVDAVAAAGDGLEELSSTSELRARRRAQAMCLFMQVAGVLEPAFRWKPGSPESVSAVLRPNTALEQSEFRAAVWGAQSGVEGLRSVMRGGIVPRVGEGRVWVLTGEPGTGKSTWTLHLAADMANRGRVAVYVSTEESELVIRDRLRMLGLLSRRFLVLNQQQFEAMLADQPDDVGTSAGVPPPDKLGDKGILVVLAGSLKPTEIELVAWLQRIALRLDARGAQARARCHAANQRFARARSRDEQVNYIEEAWRARRDEERWRWRGFVVDSLDAMRLRVPTANGDDDESKARTEISALLHAIEATRFWGILVCGANNRNRSLLAYLSDTDIELSIKNGTDLTMCVRKCRPQTVERAEHLFTIREGVGVCVVPNLLAVQRENLRRAATPLDEQRLYALDVEFHGHTLRGVPRCGRVLLSGPPHTGKTAFALSFLSAHMMFRPSGKRGTSVQSTSLGRGASILVVSFRATSEVYERRILRYKVLAAELEERVSRVEVRWYAPGDLLRPEVILKEMVDTIHRHRYEDFLPTEVVVFDGFDALRWNVPAVGESRSFFATLLATLGREQVTSLFITSKTNDVHDFVRSHSQDVDYAFRFVSPKNDENFVVELARSPESLSAMTHARGHFTVTPDGKFVAVPSRRSEPGPAT